jgi:PAS domain S-box-containing protein
MFTTEASFFRLLADNSPLFIGMCDNNLTSFYLNDAGRHLVGLDDLQHFRETQVQAFFFPEDQDFILNEFFPRVLKEGRAETEIRFRHFKTGEAIWMTYDVFSLLDESGTSVGLATVSRDISERKRVEETLREADRRKGRVPGHARP